MGEARKGSVSLTLNEGNASSPLLKWWNMTKPMAKKRTSFLFCGLLSVFLLCSCSPSWQEQIERAQSLLAQKRYQEAITVYQKALQADSKHREAPTIYLKIAAIYHFGVQEPQRALDTYRQLITHYPYRAEAFEAFKQRAEIFEEQQAWSYAIAEYSEILNRFPKRPDQGYYQFKVGILYGKNKDYRQARLELEKFLTNYSESPWRDRGHYELAELYFRNHQPKKALEHYRTILEQFPESSHRTNAEYNVGLCLEHLGEWDEALKAYEKLKGRYPNPTMLNRQIQQLKKLRQEAGRG